MQLVDIGARESLRSTNLILDSTKRFESFMKKAEVLPIIWEQLFLCFRSFKSSVPNLKLLLDEWAVPVSTKLPGTSFLALLLKEGQSKTFTMQAIYSNSQ